MLITIGITIILWSTKTLSLKSTFGINGKLIISGPYKFARHPQYLGDIIILVGGMILFNSLYVLISGLFSIIWFLMAPFTEEPFLENRFIKYNAYKKMVEDSLDMD